MADKIENNFTGIGKGEERKWCFCFALWRFDLLLECVIQLALDVISLEILDTNSY